MPDGVVLQLQREAIDEKTDIEVLLRKAYLVARKLELKDFEKWILSEQNGYKEKIPEYRMVGGSIKAWNPYRGWIPVVFEGEIGDILSKLPLGIPISSISDSYNNSDGSVCFTVPGGISDLLNKNGNYVQTKYTFHSSRAELRKIISSVRNRILEWAIMLEESGIIGDGFSFTENEVKVARESSVINNYVNNFYSSIDSPQIQQGGERNQQ